MDAQGNYESLEYDERFGLKDILEARLFSNTQNEELLFDGNVDPFGAF